MNFPMEYPFFRFLYWLVNTAGVGGIIAALAGGGAVLAYGLVLQWIRQGAEVEERETYTYPTPALHDHGREP